MPWLVDTCVLSELTRKAPSPAVVRWLAEHGRDCAMSSVTFGELQYGIERMPPGRGRNSLQAWFDRLCAEYTSRVVAIDESVWRAFARLKASLEVIGRPQQDFDVLIAATAAAHRLVLVTRNTRHFADTGVRLFNPWDGH